jgi:hypothetical protein
MSTSHEQKLEHIIRRMAADRSESAPSELIRYAKNLYSTRAVAEQPSILRKVFAALQADLAPNKAAFGERSAPGIQARQMLFDAGDNAVDLRINAAGEKFHLRGQVLGGGFGNGDARLSRGNQVFEGKLDANGGFTFAELEAGDYALTIESNETEILIEKITL